TEASADHACDSGDLIGDRSIVSALRARVASSLPRPRFQTHLLPKPVPLPNPAPHVWGNPIAELVRQHENLPAMMRLMRKHVGEHRPASRPDRSPTSAREFRHPPLI